MSFRLETCSTTSLNAMSSPIYHSCDLGGPPITDVLIGDYDVKLLAEEVHGDHIGSFTFPGMVSIDRACNPKQDSQRDTITHMRRIRKQIPTKTTHRLMR